MRLQITAHHDSLSDTVRDYAEKRIGKLGKRLHPDTLVELTLTPGRAGPVRASMHLMGAGLSPLEPREVTLALSNPEAGIEPIRRSAVRSGQGVWEVDGLLLLPAGNWSARVDLLVTDFERRTIEATVELR